MTISIKNSFKKSLFKELLYAVSFLYSLFAYSGGFDDSFLHEIEKYDSQHPLILVLSPEEWFYNEDYEENKHIQEQLSQWQKEDKIKIIYLTDNEPASSLMEDFLNRTAHSHLPPDIVISSSSAGKTGIYNISTLDKNHISVIYPSQSLKNFQSGSVSMKLDSLNQRTIYYLMVGNYNWCMHFECLSDNGFRKLLLENDIPISDRTPTTYSAYPSDAVITALSFDTSLDQKQQETMPKLIATYFGSLVRHIYTTDHSDHWLYLFFPTTHEALCFALLPEIFDQSTTLFINLIKNNSYTSTSSLTIPFTQKRFAFPPLPASVTDHDLREDLSKNLWPLPKNIYKTQTKTYSSGLQSLKESLTESLNFIHSHPK
ncbi:hypothetical protein CI610_03704 [invertebrate metagenome]|uniref:Uncharacterized protein n=1 Tax=invertebrate metagenome TaxID=1711999 RepID=A0A2H9T2D9_9ZZZZ